MLAARIGVGGIQIAVHKSPMYGWGANTITVPSQAINAHAMLQQIVAELRERYDLKE
jgi:dihydroorotate dehydrogenase